MRPVALMLALAAAWPAVARAQSSFGDVEPLPSPPPGAPTPAPAPPIQPNAEPPPAPPSLLPPPSPPPQQQSFAPRPTFAPPHRPSLPSETYAQWHRARVLYGVGSFVSLLGSGLTLSSVIVAGVTGYPCDPGNPIQQATMPRANCTTPPSPTDAAPLLAYIGSSVSALGFILSTAGLGQQHHLLDQLGAEPGRGVFSAGVSFGLVGVVSVGLSYFFGLTGYLEPHDQGIAILTTSVAAAALSVVGGLLYTVDASRLKHAWERVSSF